jgi:ferrous-iron efflux pump FieF
MAGHHHHHHSKRSLLARSLVIAGGLTAMKFAVFLFTNSTAILASAADSLTDLLLSFANFAVVRSAEKPADEQHPYGHGKIESLAGLFQGVVIGGVTLGIAAMAVRRILAPQDVMNPLAGTGITIVALVVSLWHIRNLSRSASESGSQVMRAEYIHYASDILVYVGVILSFALYRLTGSRLWDPIITLLIVFYLVKNVAAVFNQSISELMDEHLPDEELDALDRLILKSDPRVVGYHNFRTRRVGATRFIEFHVVVKGVTAFAESNDVVEGLIGRIVERYPEARLTVQADPESAAPSGRAEH